MKTIKLNIARKIALGFVGITLVSFFTTLVSVYLLQTNRKIDKNISNIILPIVETSKDFKVMVSDSRKLTSNWIYMPNENEKKSLAKIITKDFDELKNKFDVILNDNTITDSSKQFLTTKIEKFSAVIKSEAKITQLLQSDEAYSDDAIIDSAINIFDNDVRKSALELEKQLESYIKYENQNLSKVQDDKANSYFYISLLQTISLIVIFSLGLIAYYYAKKAVINPINDLKKIILALSIGKTTDVDAKSLNREDEIGEMSNAIQNLVVGLNDKINFAEEIGNQNFDKEFQLLSKEDKLGYSLLNMSNQLRKLKMEDQVRMWASQGKIQFDELLRAYNESISITCDNFLLRLVKYLNINQGCVFLKREKNGETALELTSYYAYNRKKHISKEISLTEDLVGHCFLENETIHLAKVPDDYIKITSGLGEAVPTSVLLVPIKTELNTVGVLELASFNVFEDYKIEFIKSIVQSLASVIMNINTQAQTRMLLEELKDNSDKLRNTDERKLQNLISVHDKQALLLIQEQQMLASMQEITIQYEHLKDKEAQYLLEIESYKNKID